MRLPWTTTDRRGDVSLLRDWLARLPKLEPKVLSTMPVRPLPVTDPLTKATGANLPCAPIEEGPEEAPGSISDLRPPLHTHLLAAREGVSELAGVQWEDPLLDAVGHDACPFMRTRVVLNPIVGAGPKAALATLICRRRPQSRVGVHASARAAALKKGAAVQEELETWCSWVGQRVGKRLEVERRVRGEVLRAEGVRLELKVSPREDGVSLCAAPRARDGRAVTPARGGIHEALPREWLRVMQAHGARSGRPRLGVARLQLGEYQRLGMAALDDATPLLPSNRSLGVVRRLEQTLSEVDFVCFHIHPRTLGAEDDLALFLLGILNKSLSKDW